MKEISSKILKVVKYGAIAVVLAALLIIILQQVFPSISDHPSLFRNYFILESAALIVLGSLMLLGWLFRLLTPIPSVPEELDVEYIFWRRLLFGGLGAWTYGIVMVTFLFDSGPNIFANTAFYLHSLAGAVIFLSLLTALWKRRSNTKLAILYLKIPFFFGFLAIIAIMVTYFLYE